MDAMDAIEILKAEHKAVKSAMTNIVLSIRADRTGLFTAFARELERHDAIERDVFYPSIAANPKTFGFQGVDTETRRAVSIAMRNLDALPVESNDWLLYFKTIQGILRRQMDTEEFSVFERVREALHPDEWDELGCRLVHERRQRGLIAAGAGSSRADAAPQRRPTRSLGGNPRRGS